MPSEVISWREVIKRRTAIENNLKPSMDTPAEAIAETNANADADADANVEAGVDEYSETDNQYILARDDNSRNRNDPYADSDFSNIIQGAYPYSGANQVIVCQVVPSQSVLH